MLEIPNLSTKDVFNSIPVFGLLFLLYVLCKFIVNPYLQIVYYKKQGGLGMFCWQIIPFIRSHNDAVTKGDAFYTYKQALKKQPDAKFIAENFGSKPHLLVFDLEMAKELLQKHEIYQKDVELLTLLNEVALGATPLAEGAEWKKGRRILSVAFNFEFLKNIVPIVVNTTQERFNAWIKNSDLKDVYLVEKLGEITGEVTGKFFFGKKFSEQKVRGQSMTAVIKNIAASLVMEAISLSYVFFGKKLMKANILPRHRELNLSINEFRARCKQMIDETERNPTKEANLLKHLLEMRRNGPEEDGLTDDQIVGQFVGLSAAGTDTSSHLINAALYFLKRNPRVLAKVKEEVDREFADLKNLNIDSLNRMEYTTAMLKESLRMGGPSAGILTRIAVKDDELCGVKIKQGSLLNIFHAMFYKMDKYYSRPEEFIPERWLNEKEFESDKCKSEPYTFIPFSAGPRNCLGQHLAMIEMKIIIGLFLKTFNYSFPDNYKLTLTMKFVFEPLEPLRVTLEPVDQSIKDP